MSTLHRPLIVVSKCIEFDACRYNGQLIPDGFVRQIKSHVDFIPVCPEVEIGLGVPRDPIHIVSERGELTLIQPSTGKDLTLKMSRFAASFLDTLPEVDGFILKSRSPSCGIKDVKIHEPGEKGRVITAKSAGFFGGEVLNKFPHLAVEDEGRLTNYRIREHFLTRIFASARFRGVKHGNSMGDLVQYHTENKLLLMSYNQKELRVLGRIVANLTRKPFQEVICEYADHLWRALSQLARYNSNINVLQHAFGYFSKNLSSKEKSFFLDSLERYRAERVPLSVPINILKSWIVRFDETYLVQQTFFNPYPEELVTVLDSGKGRSF